MKVYLLAIVLVFGATACESLYWADGWKEGDYAEIQVLDQEGIYETCGPNAMACAIRQKERCLVFLPEYATSQTVLHELSHCTGRVDPPVIPFSRYGYRP